MAQGKKCDKREKYKCGQTKKKQIKMERWTNKIKQMECYTISFHVDIDKLFIENMIIILQSNFPNLYFNRFYILHL